MKIFKVPFAATGDKIAIPTVEQPSGEISQPTGWTPDYQLPNTDPNYKPVGRDEMNGVLFEITEALGQLQQFGFADWQNITGGWPIGANVNHGGGVWQSLANANTEEPGTGPLWKELFFSNLVPASEAVQGLVRLATTAEAQALTDDATALTPKKLADAFLGPNAFLADPGFQRLPSGLIIQWGGVISGAAGEASWTLPIAFPNKNLYAVAIQVGKVLEAINLTSYGETSIVFNVWGGSGGVSGRQLACFAIGY